MNYQDIVPALDELGRLAGLNVGDCVIPVVPAKEHPLFLSELYPLNQPACRECRIRQLIDKSGSFPLSLVLDNNVIIPWYSVRGHTFPNIIQPRPDLYAAINAYICEKFPAGSRCRVENHFDGTQLGIGYAAPLDVRCELRFVGCTHADHPDCLVLRTPGYDYCFYAPFWALEWEEAPVKRSIHSRPLPLP